MKAIFGLLGLLVTLAIVVTVVKQQMGSASKTLGQPAASSAQGESVRIQSQQAQQQFRQAVEAAMVPARTASEEQ